MKRIDDIISDITKVNKENQIWIYDRDGNIKDNIICGSVIEFLYELRPFEIDATEMAIDTIVEDADCRWNTYNWNAKIDHDLDVAEKNINGYLYMAIMVHRYGDVRANYTDRFLVRFNDVYEWYDIESRTQYKKFGDEKDEASKRYCADIDIFSDTYNVYDWETYEDIGEFCEIEADEVLKEIEERRENKV